MNKIFKTGFCLLLCVGLLATTAMTGSSKAANTILNIASVEEWLQFAENCRLDSYSDGLTVSLQADIDLSDTTFEGVPTFGGTFEGNGHRIKGFLLKLDGSVQGLFRYLRETATVRDLAVEGRVSPSGTRGSVGGLTGNNAGTIENCTFIGSVSGADSVGGLVGINAVSGIIDSCRAEGDVYGKHFVGGIAGENHGVIRKCVNRVKVNATARQNGVSISDITLGTLSGAESVNTVTDIGGIAGISSGIIRDSENHGQVGYPHMGYNIGGIAGTQSGYLADCRNDAPVNGRKEVGGIVGQMEPIARLIYETDALQRLQPEIERLAVLIDRMATNTQNNTGEVSRQITLMEGYVTNAETSLDVLIPDRSDQSPPDADTMLAALQALNSSVIGIYQTVENLSSTLKTTTDTLNNDMQAITEQMDVISGILDTAADDLGGEVADVSDQDTAKDQTGKVSDCENDGAIMGDLNVGGIVGAIAFENDLDPEDDVTVSGAGSLNFRGEFRAVILDCRNGGMISVRKQNAGGIVGWMSMGLVKNGTNTGAIDAQNADHVGGIAGRSDGYIRFCHVKTTLLGSTAVGGIAGIGSTVSDCRSMVSVNGSEQVGAVLGKAQDREKLAGNYYLVVGRDSGAVDGISYAGLAEPLEREAFLALTDLNGIFRTVTVSFIFEDGTKQSITTPIGGSVSESQIPVVPSKEGYIGVWEGLEETNLSAVYFDAIFQAAYLARSTVIQSDQLQENELPIVLIQGDFEDSTTVKLTKLEVLPALPEGQTGIGGWRFTVPETGTPHELRYALPSSCDAKRVRLLVQDRSGEWREAAFTVNGSYLVLAITADDEAFYAVQLPADYRWVWLAVGAAMVVIAAVAFIVWSCKRKKKKVDK